MKNPPNSVAHLDFVAGIPTLDLSHFTSGTAEQRQQFVDDLGAAYRSVGFVAISGHGIESSVIDDMYTTAEQFFALPTEVKMKHEHPEHNRQRGFVSFGTEHAKDSKTADLKEFWQVGQTNIPNGADLSHYPPNAILWTRACSGHGDSRSVARGRPSAPATPSKAHGQTPGLTRGSRQRCRSQRRPRPQ